MCDVSDQRLSTEQAVVAYKTLLKEFIDRRPSGTRQRLAEALGTHKSFISQITNPAYRIPLPAQHVATIIKICHFSPEERKAFMAAFRVAHANQASAVEADIAGGSRTIQIEVPQFSDPGRQERVVQAIQEMAKRIIALATDIK